MFGLGPRELIVLALLFVLLFGTKKIPELARGLGEGVKILRGTFSSETDKTDKTDKKS